MATQPLSSPEWDAPEHAEAAPPSRSLEMEAGRAAQHARRVQVRALELREVWSRDAAPGRSLVQELIEDRRREAENA